MTQTPVFPGQFTSLHKDLLVYLTWDLYAALLLGKLGSVEEFTGQTALRMLSLSDGAEAPFSQGIE